MSKAHSDILVNPSPAEMDVCLSCRGTLFKTLLKGNGAFSILECSQCALGKTVPPEAVYCADYDDAPQLANEYTKREALTAEYANLFLDLISGYAKVGKLLDVGCSIGVLVEEAGKRGFDAYGIDLDHNAIDYALSRGRSVQLSRLEDINAASYDVICLQHTLEHIPDPLGFLEGCRRALNIGGLVAISVPCHDGFHPRIFKSRWYGWQPTQHYYHYSSRSMGLLLSRAGFRVLRVLQNSMDHRIAPGRVPIRQALKSRVMSWVAAAGAAIGRGDQLIAFAKREAE